MVIIWRSTGVGPGVRLRCWSDRDSGTIALVFDATTAGPGGLLASIHWRLQRRGEWKTYAADMWKLPGETGGGWK